MITNYERLERLRNLRDLLTRHVKARGKPIRIGHVCRAFNMDYWNCGTAACALGSAALHPWFIKKGLSVRHSDVYFDDYYGFRAGAEFFGIDRWESFNLFDPAAYLDYNAEIKPTAVRKRVDALIKKYSKET